MVPKTGYVGAKGATESHDSMGFHSKEEVSNYAEIPSICQIPCENTVPCTVQFQVWIGPTLLSTHSSFEKPVSGTATT